jgi:murein DD-endopeptidase MepM/ murein hydrolase activator NlpD
MAARASRGTPVTAGDAQAARLGGAVHLGIEPPIAAAGDRQTLDRRSVSLRWLAGTILAGLSGALLIGSAIYISLDGEMTFAKRPEAVIAMAIQAGSDTQRSNNRGDRILPAPEIISAKQAFRTPTTIRVGNKEVIKIKPFVRISTTLALGPQGFAEEIPAFNPFKLYSAGGPIDKAPEPEPNEGDAEVSVQRHSLGVLSDQDQGFVLGEDQVAAQVEEERRNAANGQRASLPFASQLLLSRTLPTPGFPDDFSGFEGPSDTAFSAIQISVVPENVTAFAKLPAQESGAPPPGSTQERLIVAKRGETLDQILRANNAGQPEARSAIAAIGSRAVIREGSRLRLLFGQGPNGRPIQLLRVIVQDDERIIAIAAVDDRNAFVPVSPPGPDGVAVASAPQEDEDDSDDESSRRGRGMRLYDSLYETALKNEVPRAIIDQLVRIYFYDVDLQRRVSSGDSFEVFYGEDEDTEGRPELLYASLFTNGTLRRYYRYFGSGDDAVDFFDELGKSNRKFLVRKPIADGAIRSGFGMRYHPILRYSKMHTGVDWANKTGTPIFAAGDGLVRSANWSSGYGRRVELEHAYNFVTTYSHMSGFARGLREGSRVRQGQVIGYVGNTGLSTGPHLHYEVLVNDTFVDPLSIKLPRNRELDQKQLAEFKRERERIDELMRKAPTATRVADKTR